jgi:nitrate reductase beta subunit
MLFNINPNNKLVPTINNEYADTVVIYDVVAVIIKKDISPTIAPVNNITTHKISNIDLTPTIEDAEINIQYNKNKNINDVKKLCILV